MFIIIIIIITQPNLLDKGKEALNICYVTMHYVMCVCEWSVCRFMGLAGIG